jgi:LAS seventeen-binding protein 5
MEMLYSGLLDSNKTTGTFADGYLTDAFKNIALDPNADKRVKKKLILVLASWRDQFSSDPSMTLVAGLFKQCRGDGKRMTQQALADTVGLTLTPEETRRVEKEEMRKKEKLEKATKGQERQKKKRTLFDFEKVFFVISLVIASSSIC